MASVTVVVLPSPGTLFNVWGEPLNAAVLTPLIDGLNRLEVPLGVVAEDDATALAGMLPNIAAMRRLVLAPLVGEGAILLQAPTAGPAPVNLLLAVDPSGAPVTWIQDAGNGFGTTDRVSIHRGVLQLPTQQWDVYGYERRNGRTTFAHPGRPGNLLSYEDACQEGYEGTRSGTVGSWQIPFGFGSIDVVPEPPGVATPAGSYSALRATAGDTTLTVVTGTGINGYPVVEHEEYSALIAVRAEDVPDGAKPGIQWFDDGDFLSQSLAPSPLATAVGAWAPMTSGGLTAPTGATRGAPCLVVPSTVAGREFSLSAAALYRGDVAADEWAPPFVGDGAYGTWGEAAEGSLWLRSGDGAEEYVCTTAGTPQVQDWAPRTFATELSTANPQPLGTAAPGTTGQGADAGHVHPITGVLTPSSLSNATPAPVGATGSAGASTNVARADHAHAGAVGLGLQAWRQGLADRLYNTVNIVAIGSSTTQGLNATLTERWVDQLGRDLHARYNAPAVAGGRHILGIDDGGSPWAFTGTHSTDSNGLALSSVTLATSATMTRTVDPCTGFDVQFPQGPGAGAFTVSIDGGTAVTVTPNTDGTANRHDGVYSSPTVSSGSHSIAIAATASTAISGVYARNGDESAGIRVYSSGLAGTNAASFATASQSLYQRLAALSPAMITVMLGANDYSGQTASATFRASMQTIVDRIVGAVTPTPSIWFLGTYARLDVFGAGIPWSSYLADMATVAAANPGVVEYVDISGSYPTTQAAAQSRRVIDPADYVHQTRAGHRMMADLLTAALLAPPPPVISAPAFSPRLVGGLLSWFDAGAVGLSNGTAVSSWSPTAGVETAALAQATSGQRPVYQTNRVNSRPAVVFTAASAHNLDTGTWAGKRLTPLTIISVVKFATGNTGNAYSGRSGVYAYLGNNTGSALSIGAGATAEINSTVTQNAWHVIAAVYNGASSAIYRDSHTATLTGTTSTGTNAALPGLRLGTNSGASGVYLDGEIAEIGIWNRALTAAEITALVNYFGDKYAIAIS